MAPTPASMCTALKTLNGSLSNRRRYMKHNFPINYTIRVHYEEVFKLSNINRMRLHVEGLDELVLQRLWFQVNRGVLKKVFQQELPESIQDTWDHLTEEPSRVPESSWRSASPKSLLDNLCHTMHCLSVSALPAQKQRRDYCSVSHWKKGKKKNVRPRS
ncbi:hypothetical protein KUCAC02_021663 [Chaenocephalus aceratus]|uniref:Uncharacterized protein n=1 Tax=Chaenocephalus aceratus TaxID=36190 RepID=A0ACB9XIC6_CHAAC|nr:hypothetical protein KUCAC02_021663 [Chaenocephalus aceratus]